MTLLQADQWSVSAALANVQAEATALAKARDEPEIKAALLSVRHAAMKAYGLLDEAAKRARDAALAPLDYVA